jgi:hypothetical protein
MVSSNIVRHGKREQKMDNLGTHNVIVLHAEGFAPCTHHVGVVVSDDNNLVDSLLFEFGKVGDVAREMFLGTSSGEGTRGRDQDDLLISEFYRCAVLLVSR